MKCEGRIEAQCLSENLWLVERLPSGKKPRADLDSGGLELPRPVGYKYT